MSPKLVAFVSFILKSYNTLLKIVGLKSTTLFFSKAYVKKNKVVEPRYCDGKRQLRSFLETLLDEKSTFNY